MKIYYVFQKYITNLLEPTQIRIIVWAKAKPTPENFPSVFVQSLTSENKWLTRLATVTQSVTKTRGCESSLHSQRLYVDLELYAEGFLCRVCLILGHNNGRGNIIPPPPPPPPLPAFSLSLSLFDKKMAKWLTTTFGLKSCTKWR